MDAALWELLEEGDGEDEIAAIIRLGQPGIAPPGVRLVTQFGHIATCRLKRGAILTTREDESVASFKAARVLAPEPEIEESLLEDLPESLAFVDERRPPDEAATGRGVVVGVVDWGCDFAHPDFRNPDGSTRLLALWDQRSRDGSTSPNPYGYGVVHAPQAINQALAAADPYAALNYHPADADTGKGSHGTHVLSIAAGNGGGGGPQGVAPEALLVFVHSAPFAHEESDRLGDSVTLLEAVDFIARLAGDRPWVINLSMGRHGEQHDGSTLVEQGLDEALRSAPGCAIVQSTGNYFERGIHSSGQLRPTEERTLTWEVEEVDPTPNQLEIWYSGLDSLEIELNDPAESIRSVAALGEQAVVSLAGREIGKIYHRRSEPNNLCNHIEIFLYAGAPGGRWAVTLKGKDIVDGRYHAWIERDAACPRCQSKFSAGDAVAASTTGTICNGFRTIAVGAYNPHSPRHGLAPFSSSGPTRDGRMKPDLLAPGVRILAARSMPRESVDGRELLTRMSGTSMASPYVAGTVALMFEVAPRRLRIEETHNLLLSRTRKTNLLGENIARLGSGYCEISDAVAAARTIGGPTRPDPHQTTKSEAEVMKKFESEDSPAPEVASPPAATEDDGWALSADKCDAFETEVEALSPEDEQAAEGIPSSDLQWSGASSEQLAFMRRVYEQQVQRASRRRAFVGDIPAVELDVIEGAHSARIPTATACRALLSQARTALSEQQREGVPQALGVGGVHIASAYRSASRQFNGWQSAFPRYYSETQAERATRGGGEHGEAAAEYLAHYIGDRLAAPGYSLHNNGLAVDFGTREHGRRLGPSTSRDSIDHWRASWLFRWMTENAARNGFYQNTSINEPWHWEYRRSESLAGQRESDYFREYDTEDVNVERAVRMNRSFAQSLGWQAHYDRINPLLGYTNSSPGEEDLALAVGRWQISQGLTADGVIGPGTWARMRVALGLGQPSAPAPVAAGGGSQPLSGGLGGAVFTPAEEKALRLTNAFESTGHYARFRTLNFSGLSGDFDQQGLSFGLLQWNFGTGSLPPLLREFANNYSQRFDAIFGSDAAQLRQVLGQSRDEQMRFIRSINNYSNPRSPHIIEPWAGYFRSLAADTEFQQIQLQAVRPRMNQAIASTRHFGLQSERGLAFMFDTVTQHGGGWLSVGSRNARIQQQRAAREQEVGRGLNEIELLTIIANVIADSVRSEYIEDVRRRRMTIVNGQGVVHGHNFNLEADFDIKDQPWEAATGGVPPRGRREQEFDRLADTEYDEAIPSTDADSDEFAEDYRVTAGREEVSRVSLLRRHLGSPPDLILRWNNMQDLPIGVDVVVHLHGFSGRGVDMHLRRDKELISGLDFSNPDDRTDTTPGRQRPTLCILPRGNFFGGENGNGYDFPALTNATGLRELIDFSLNRFAQRVGTANVRMYRLIITAHSGGGAALVSILSHPGNNPEEVHLFDGLYGHHARLDVLINWARNRLQADQIAINTHPSAVHAPQEYLREHGGALRVFYIPRTGTANNSLAVHNAISAALAATPVIQTPTGSSAQPFTAVLDDWYRVEAVSNVAHLNIPRQFGWRLLVNASANLPNTSPPDPASHRRQAEAETDESIASPHSITEAAANYEPAGLSGYGPQEGRLIEAADEAVVSVPQRSFSSGPMFGGVFESIVGKNPFTSDEQSSGSLSSAALFEAFAYGNNPAARQHLEQFFEIVALPRSPLPEIRPGYVLVRHAPGEGGFTHMSMLATGDTFRADELASAGIIAESTRPGRYATVIEAGPFPHRASDQYARLVTDESGLLTHDSLILRIRQSDRPPRPRLIEATESDAAEAEPTVTPGRDPEEIIVTRADGSRYHVRRKVRAQVLTHPGRPRMGFCHNDERVFLRASWCEGTQGTIDVGANIPAAFRDLLNTVVGQINRGERPEEIARTFENAQVQPFVELDITKVDSWKITGDLKLDINRTGILSTTAKVSADKRWIKIGAEYKDDGTGKQVLVTADIPLGDRTVRGKKCPVQELAIWWDAECLREVPTTNTIQVPGFRENEETLYLYFEHSKDILRRDPKATTESADVVNEILQSDPKLGTALLNKRKLQRLDYLVGQGYWLDSVKGYTSPEGLRGPAAGWKGNTRLSENRANKVLELVKARYGDMPTSLQMRDLPPRMRFPSGKSMPSGVGLSENPKLDVRPGVELEGAMLDRVMIHGGVKIKCSELDDDVDKKAADRPFLEQCPEELPRMTEDDRKYVTDPRISDRRRAERLFENLRRVEIHLRQREKLRDVDVPGTSLVHEHNCPPDVIEAAERKWGSRIPFTKPDPPLCGLSEMEISSGEQSSFEQVPSGGAGPTATCLTPGVIFPSTGSPAFATRHWFTRNPRGVCRVGQMLYVVNRETGAINQFSLDAEGLGRPIWTGPGLEFGPFVGPTWVPQTHELVVAALGRDNWDRGNPRAPGRQSLGTRVGTLLAVNLHGGYRTICSQSYSSAHQRALDGCAGTTMLPNGYLAVSGFWSQQVSAVDVRTGAIQPLFTLADRNPDGLCARSSGELLICDRTQGELLAASIGGTPRALVCGIRDPIAVDIDTAGNALVLSKTDTVVYKVGLRASNGGLIATSCRPIATAPPFGRGCLSLNGGRDSVIIVVDSDTEDAVDGLYQT